MLATARLLLDVRHAPGIRPGQITASLGFPYPGHPHSRDPLQRYLSR
jgi:hypothetical protein